MQDIAKLVGVDKQSVLKGQQGFQEREAPEFSAKKSNTRYQRSVTHPPIQYATILLLNNPALVQLVKNPEQIAFSELPGTDLLTTLIESVEESPHINAITLLERWRHSDLESELLQLMKSQPNSDDVEIMSKEFSDCLVSIEKQARKSKLEELFHKQVSDGLSDQEKGDIRFLTDQLSVH